MRITFKKLILTLVFIFACKTAFSQTYEFDHVLEYEYKTINDKGDTRSGRNYVFLNSKDNTSKLITHEMNGSVYMQLVTLKTNYFSSIPRDNFFVEALSFQCPHNHPNRHPDPTKEYTISKLQDTIINTVKCSHYLMHPLNEKKFKKGKALQMHYIIEHHPDFTLPVASASIGSYKAWQAYGTIPSGIIKEWYETDAEGRTHSYQKLLQVIKIKKYILIENKGCK